MTVRRSFLFAAALTAAVAVAGGRPVASAQNAAGGPRAAVLIFAAASVQTALDALAPKIKQATGITIKTSYAASSALARQIESGAPASIFISADLDWMDYVAARDLIRVESRVNLLGNTLVLVAPASAARPVEIRPSFGLAAALGQGRLAVANPDAVPAGKYAKAALTFLGVWDSVSAKLAPAENVRAAVLLVSRGEAPLGIVYKTDAAADTGVTIVGTFPENSHPPIVYPAALTTVAVPDATKVMAYLRGPEARTVFVHEGFVALIK